MATKKTNNPKRTEVMKAREPKAKSPKGKKRAAKSKRPKILVTGISGRLGRLLAKRLHRIAEVHGVDGRDFDNRPKDVTLHQIDLRKKRCEDLFRLNKFEAVFHLGIIHDPRRSVEEHHSFNLGGSMKILEYCQRYKVPKVVVLSSANIYGPHPNNPIFLTEDAPLMAGQRFPQIRDLIELDMLAQSFFWKQADIETVILRPVHIVGPTMRNGITKYLSLDVIPRLMGFDPMVQLIHEEDVVRALVLAMEKGVRGIFNIAGATAAPLSEVIKQMRRPCVPIPHPLAKSLINLLWDLKIADFRAPEIDYARYICTVDTKRAEEILGFTPKYSMLETLESVRSRMKDI